MDLKLIGGALLIIGTSIGAGMLALPIATSQLGFLGSVILLVLCWFVMTLSALLLLEVNLWLPQRSHIISMARVTIGPLGQIIAWGTYLLLLYSLLCAYIAGGSDLFQNLLTAYHLTIPQWLSAVIFTFLFSTVVFLGIRTVDYTNRGLMLVKFAAYFLLVILLFPFINSSHLNVAHLSQLTSVTAITVTITSFGYSPIVPSLRVYFAGDLNKLRKTIIYGSLIPLVCYIIWDAAIMGILPVDKLIELVHSDNSTSTLVNSLTQTAASERVTFFTKLFTSICMLTSFLGVGLCLTDFLADGLQMEKKGYGQLLIHSLAFIPPLLIVVFYPNAFIKALSYAGIYCIILLILLPAWMAWRGRYKKFIARGYQVAGGKPLLIGLMIFSVIFIAWSILG